MDQQISHIPECVELFKRQFDVIEKVKVQKMKDKLERLKQKNKMLMNSFKIQTRNEKYKFQGFRALQATNPYITQTDTEISKNLFNLQINPDSQIQVESKSDWDATSRTFSLIDNIQSIKDMKADVTQAKTVRKSKN